MKILLTGATGYIAQRLLPVLLGNGNEVICCVRDSARFDSEKYRSQSLSVLEVDFLKPETLQNIPSDIDAAYYLIHSMSTSTGDFEKMEEISAINFKNCIQQTKARQVIYLSGIVNEKVLSKHLTSRRNVERILGSGSYSLTTLRAGIIIGSGSAETVINRIWSIGGSNGWYYADWLWGIRGFIDKLFGGVGLRRGRKNQNEISPGEALDFWCFDCRQERKTIAALC